MKIGILTYHRTNNYGACLQAIATRLVLEKMGHEAYYVDYWPDYHANTYKVFSFNNMKSKNLNGKIAYLLHAFSCLNEKRERIRNFDNFINQYIAPYCKPMSEHYDIVIYGSDQIWRKQSSLKDYNPVYFADIKAIANKHIAFSASMGILPDNTVDYEKIKRLIFNFDKIAVREDNLKELLDSMGYNGVKRVLDPTLLLSGDEWAKYLDLDKKVDSSYVLVYYITKTAFDMNAIREFAKSKGMTVKVICGNAAKSKDNNNLSTIGPKEFLSLFKNASYTFVTSFHGLAFSLIFEKQFFASFYNNANRAKTLLSMVGLVERLLPPKSILKDDSPIEYKLVRNRMCHERELSLEILKSYLSAD